MKWRHAAHILSLAALAARGSADEAVLVQPGGYTKRLERVRAPAAARRREARQWFTLLDQLWVR